MSEKRFRLAVFTFCLLIGQHAYAQPPVAQFSVKAAACLNENVPFTNQSTGANRYEWDMCQGDLSLLPSSTAPGTLTGSTTPTGVDVVYDGSSWFAFVTSRDNHSIMRVDLGANQSGFSGLTNLGNIDSKLNLPTDIKIVSENGEWYGFVYNEGPNVICRLDFGTSLTNTPTATLIVTDNTSTSNQGLDVIFDGTFWHVVYSFNSKVGVIRLPTIESIPGPSDKMLSTDIAANLGDVKVLQGNGDYFVFVAPWNVLQLYRLSYGPTLFSAPAIGDVSAALPATSLNYYGIDAGNDNGNIYLMFATLQGPVVRLNLGSDLNASPVASDVIGNLGIIFNTVKNRLVKNQSSWYYYSVDYVNGTLFRVSFPAPTCSISPEVMTSTDLLLQFQTPGPRHFSLRSFNDQTYDDAHATLTITAGSAPSISFSNQQSCIDVPVQFMFDSDQTIVSQSWDFGDGNFSNLPSPDHNYATVDTYDVTLEITSSGGCDNYLKQAVSIYNAPVSSFTLPTTTPICTNQPYTFTNTSSFDSGSNPTWDWQVNGSSAATSQNLTQAFATNDPQEIKLVASIPGCSSESMQSLNTIEIGPLADFAANNGCEDNPVQFTNTTVGIVTSISWDFDDGNMSMLENPINTFEGFGTFNVKLQTQNAAGCQNEITKPITIYSKPQPDFNIALPPFSCAGSMSQFTDLTPAPPDSNLESWAWSFGDPLAGTSTQKDPQYQYTTAGDYLVDLVVTTNFGCTASVQKSVSILPSPTAAFSTSAACIAKPTALTDSSAGSIASWLWTVGTSHTYTLQNPTHVFTNPGDYNVQLTVTGSNNCVSSTSKMINVPVPPTLNFLSTNNCEDQLTTFADATTPSADMPSSWTWDFAGIMSTAGSTATHQFDAPGVYGVTMSVTNQSGCVYSISKNVTISPTPVASFYGNPPSGPAPLEVQFTNTSVGSTSYTWKFNDGTGATSALTAPQFTYTALGDYLVELTATNDFGCASSFSDFVSVIIPSLDVALTGLTLVPNANTGTMAVVVDVTNNSNYQLSELDVRLELSVGAVLSEKVVTSLPPGASKTITLSNQLVSSPAVQYACVSLEAPSDKDLLNNKLCANLADELSSVYPFPNPNSGTVTLEWIAASTGDAEVTVYNESGQAVFEQTITSFQEGLNRITLDLSSLHPGPHYLIFASGSYRKTYPLIIQP
ncbi:MAG: PKD domain-containing protein [Cyclobacteriaceae bacterium]